MIDILYYTLIPLPFVLLYSLNIFTTQTQPVKLKIAPESIMDKLDTEINVKVSELNLKYKKSPKIFTSLLYLSRDLLLATTTIMTTYFIQKSFNVSQYIIYPLYSVIMGTVTVGFWVLGHECGHGAFGDNSVQNDIIGFIIHSFLLVPYFSWKYSHLKHHKYTNHLILGETHVPSLHAPRNFLRKIIGEDAFTLIDIIGRLSFGWIFYLFFNETGGRTQYDCKTRIDKTKNKSHFISSSQVMKPSWKIELSTIGCLATLIIITYTNTWYWYIGPYLIVNAWLVLYTFLQHTHPDVPHYGSDKFTFLKGALCTIDRPYPYIIDILHHHIGTTHVLHHINYSIPHYRAVEYTNEIKKILGEYYLYDPTPIYIALFQAARYCVYMDSLEGIQYFKYNT